MGMVGLAIALPPPSVHEIRLESDMFVTRINFDFRIAHCEPKYVFTTKFAEKQKKMNMSSTDDFFLPSRVSELLDYTAEELTGKNLYALCHGEDANRLRKSHMDREYFFIINFILMFNKKKKFDKIHEWRNIVRASRQQKSR